MKQTSRESLIYLLYLALYADGILSETEDDSFSQALNSLTWESETSLEEFSVNAFGTVRELISTPEQVMAFLHDHAMNIKRADDAMEAFTLISRVLKADSLENIEKSYLKKLEQLWFAE